VHNSPRVEVGTIARPCIEWNVGEAIVLIDDRLHVWRRLENAIGHLLDRWELSDERRERDNVGQIFVVILQISELAQRRDQRAFKVDAVRRSQLGRLIIRDAGIYERGVEVRIDWHVAF
jgi:hypothetical protein